MKLLTCRAMPETLDYATPADAVPLPDPIPLRRRLAAEFVGTFLLIFFGCGSMAVDAAYGGAVGHVGVGIVWGVVVLAMIYAVGDVSGAHLNPAVSFAFWMSGRFRHRDVFPYVMAYRLRRAGWCRWDLAGGVHWVLFAGSLPNIWLYRLQQPAALRAIRQERERQIASAMVRARSALDATRTKLRELLSDLLGSQDVARAFGLRGRADVRPGLRDPVRRRRQQGAGADGRALRSAGRWGSARWPPGRSAGRA